MERRRKIAGVLTEFRGKRQGDSAPHRLEHQRMDDRAVPAMGVGSFEVDSDIEAAMKQAQVWSKFKSFPSLYQRVRAGNVAFYKRRNPAMYEQMLSRLIAETKKGQMYGEWNDYGRLLDY